MPLLATINDRFISPVAFDSSFQKEHSPPTGKVKLGDLTLLMGMGRDGLQGANEELGLTLWHVPRQTPLFHENGPCLSLYVVRSGGFKCLRNLEDGYEQVLSFVLRGELLGFEALHCDRQTFTAVALEDSTVYGLPLRHLNGIRQRCPALDTAIYTALSRRLQHAADYAEMMAAVASEVRLSRFLLWMSKRHEDMGQSPRRMLLRMSRRDIASLLGIAHETVSRSFSSLAERGFIQVSNREVTILDLDLLNAHASSTRGQQEDLPLSAVH